MTLHSPQCVVALVINSAYVTCAEYLACTALQAREPLQALPATKAATHARCSGLQAVLAGFAARAASLAHSPGAPKQRAPALPAGSGSADSTLTAVGARRAADGHVVIGLGSLGSSRPGSGKARAGRLGPGAAARAAAGGADGGAGGGAQTLLGSGAGALRGAAPMLRVTAAVAARLSASYRQDCGSLASMPALGPTQDGSWSWQDARCGFVNMQSFGAGRGTLRAHANPAAAAADAAHLQGQNLTCSPSLAHPHASVRAAAQYLAVVAAGRAFGAPPAPGGPGAEPLGLGGADPAELGLPIQEPCPGSAAIGGIAAAGSGREPWGKSRSEDTSSQHPLAASQPSASVDSGLAAAGGLAGKSAATVALAQKAAVEAQEAHVLQKGLENLMAWMRESAGGQAAGGGDPHPAPVRGTPPPALLP